MEIIRVKLTELKPYGKNPRKNDEAAKAVAKSIEQCGYVAPIIVDENMEILAGHTRLKALTLLKYTEVDCLVKRGLSEAQKRKYRLLDNKTNELAEWDMSLLADELEDLDFLDLDLDWGISFEDEEEPEVKEDNYTAALPEEPKAKRGDIYQLGRHRLMCGDSTMIDDVQKLVNGMPIDLFLTDPPYNVALGMGGSVDEARIRHRRTDGLVIMNDKMENDQFREFLTTVFSNAKAVMKPGASFYVWHADNEGYNFRGACMDAGFQVRQCLIWKKQSITLGRQDYQWIHEPCLYGWNDGASHSWYSDRKQSTVLQFDRPTKSEIHPTMKPIALFDYQIKNSSKSGDAVLDLFNGSGTTIMACEQNGRNAYCMELDPKYVDAAIERWEEFSGEKAVLLNGEL